MTWTYMPGMVRRIKQKVPQVLLFVIFQIAIHIHIDYCILVWGYASDIYLYKIMCDHFDWNVCASALVKRVGVCLALEKDVIILWVFNIQIFNEQSSSVLVWPFSAVSDVHFCGSRYVILTGVYMYQTSNESFLKSLFYMAPVIWNNLISFLKSAISVYTFKKHYKKPLRNWRCFYWLYHYYIVWTLFSASVTSLPRINK